MAAIIDGRHTYRPQAIGRVFGWFFLATFLTSIPAFFVGYSKMLDNPGSITGSGVDPSSGISAGAALEVLLIVANVATAVIVYPVLKRESEMGAVGYVAARLCEAMFIAIGIIGALAFLLMRQEGTRPRLHSSAMPSCRRMSERSSSDRASGPVSRMASSSDT